MRVFDASEHNRIANHPAVRASFPWYEGEIDFSDQVADAYNYVFLLENDAAAIFEWSAPGTWQVHTMAMPDCRGRRAIEIGKRMVAWMRESMGAERIWGMTPKKNRAACMFNRLMGARCVGGRAHHYTGMCFLFEWRL